jgi:hypothetical protein
VKPFQALFRNFPAFSRALVIAVGISGLVWLSLWLLYRDARPSIFLLGDSCIGNYRLHPGHRFQEMLESADPSYRVENWAEPGACPLDFLLQYEKGCLIAGKPRRVVIAMTPDKFLKDGGVHRFDEDGVNLRWIPFSKSGMLIWNSLSPRERNVAVVQKISLFGYTILDLSRALWIRYVQWPWERRSLKCAGRSRKQRVREFTTALGKQLETLEIGSDQEFDSLPKARDADILIRALQSEGIQTIVLVLPYGNSALIESTYSPLALAKRDSTVVRMRDWLEERHVDYLDFNAPEHRVGFPDSQWDDNAHIKLPGPFHYMTRQVVQHLAVLR